VEFYQQVNNIALNVGSAVLLLAQLYLVTCGGISQTRNWPNKGF